MRGVAAVATVALAFVAACIFPEKVPGETDAAPMVDAPVIDAPMIDASVIDAPVIDAPMIDAPVIDAPAIDASMIDAAQVDAAQIDAAPVDAPVDGPPVCPTCDVNARCINATCLCNWGWTGNGLTCASAVDSLIESSSDGRTTSVSSGGFLESVSFLRNLGGVVHSSGNIWFTEGTTSCPDSWDLRTARFTPSVAGPTSFTASCEGEVDDPVGTTIAAAGAARLACFQTHAPGQTLRCGPIGADPGTYTNTVDLGNPRDGTQIAAATDGAGNPSGFGVHYTQVDVNGVSLGTRLARLDVSGGGVGVPVALSAGEYSVELGRIQNHWVPFRINSTSLEITANFVDDNGTIMDTVAMNALPPATAFRMLATAPPESGAVHFVYTRDQDLYLGDIAAQGAGSLKRFAMAASQVTGAAVAPIYSGYAILYSNGTTISYVRTDGTGIVLESPRVIATGGSAISLIGAAYDGAAVWVVYATTAGGEAWDVYARRIQ